MITAAEMARIEEECGIPPAELMENAGTAAAGVIRERYPDATVLVIAYHGNNGGDGFVVARELGCDVWFIGDEAKLSDEARTYHGQVPRFVEDPDLDSYDVLVDALLGTGSTPPLRGRIAELAAAWNDATAAKVALDIPTGVHPDTGDRETWYEPDLVIAFHDTKRANADLETITVDIGVKHARPD